MEKNTSTDTYMHPHYGEINADTIYKMSFKAARYFWDTHEYPGWIEFQDVRQDSAVSMLENMKCSYTLSNNHRSLVTQKKGYGVRHKKYSDKYERTSDELLDEIDNRIDCIRILNMIDDESRHILYSFYILGKTRKELLEEVNVEISRIIRNSREKLKDILRLDIERKKCRKSRLIKRLLEYD